MNYKTRIFLSVLAGVGFSGCEQRDDQALIKVYEVFQRDMQKRDETAKASMEQIQGEIKAVSDKLEQLQTQAPAGGGGGEKLAAAVADVKSLTEQNAATLAEVKAQIAQLRTAPPQPVAAIQPAPIAAAPAPAPAPTLAPSGGQPRYRDQPPAEPRQPAPSSMKSSDPSRKKYKIEF